MVGNACYNNGGIITLDCTHGIWIVNSINVIKQAIWGP